MSNDAKALGLDDKLKSQDLLYGAMFHTGEGKVFGIAFAIAIVLHAIILLINFPEFKKAIVPQKSNKIIVVKKYVPPPPKVERQQVVRKKITKKVPIPDPTPDEPEPIREPEPELEPEPLPPDVEFVIGVPEAPPPSGPLLAGVGDVTNPVLIPESKIDPEYPELARVARLEGNVILQAIIHSDGSVGEVEVLRTNRPNMGFEEAAIAAVTQWRYKPAEQNGRPVEVYFTVFVEFKLH
jgi:protein TonB